MRVIVIYLVELFSFLLSFIKKKRHEPLHGDLYCYNNSLTALRRWNVGRAAFGICTRPFQLSLLVMQTGARVLPGGRAGAVGRIAAVQSRFLCEDNLQLCNRAFYAPPSPVIGCHRSCVRWGGRLHGSFPDFPGDFFFSPPLPPAALPLYMASKPTR